MEPKTLSASAASVFETCEARYRAAYIDRTPEISNKAADLGSACHEALEIWVEKGYHVAPWPDIMARERAMNVVWESVYPDYFADREFFAEGWGMLRKWLQEQDWDGRTVISTEQKKFFEIPTSRGPLKFNYIIDRMDKLDDGTIDVVDYKSVRIPITHDRMKNLIQVRCYAVAAMIEYPEAPEIWVTYDLLRYNKVGVRFTREECVTTWKYLRSLAERIYASDGTEETLNPECRFCVRKQVCDTLKRNVNGGGVLSMGTIEEITDQLSILENAKGGLDSAIRELQEHGIKLAEEGGLFEWETETAVAKIKASSRREVDSELAAKILGPEMMMRYGKLGVGTVEDIIKEEELTDSQKSQLKQLMRKKYGTPRIDVKPKSPFEDQE